MDCRSLTRNLCGRGRRRESIVSPLRVGDTIIVQRYGIWQVKLLYPKLIITKKYLLEWYLKLAEIATQQIYFKKLKILKFRDKVDYKILQVIYKAKQKSLPTNIQILFGINYGKDYNTRQLNKFYVTYSRTVLKSRCLSIYGVKMWNNLDEVARTYPSFLAFKILKNEIFKEILKNKESI